MARKNHRDLPANVERHLRTEQPNVKVYVGAASDLIHNISPAFINDTSLGAKLLKYAEQISKQELCETLRLCTGIDNERGIKFYEKNGWTRRAYAYSKKLKSE